MWSRHKKMRGADFRNHRASDRQGGDARASTPAGVLQPRVGHGGQHDVAVPADKRATLEMIEPELVLQFFVLLLDRPAMMRQPHESAEGRRRGQRDQSEE